MNDEELKTIWQTESNISTVDTARLGKLSDDWERKWSRKARIDAWVQGVTTAACLVPVFFYPRLIFAAVLVVILGVWYVRDLRRLYKSWGLEPESVSVRESTMGKIEYLSRFLWRTRIVVYIAVPVTLLLTYFGLGFFDDAGISSERWVNRLAIILPIAEILTIIFCEVYFLVLYRPALKELREISRQLDSGKV